jgi:hypothetical protein
MTTLALTTDPATTMRQIKASSNIAALGYDERTRALTVTFKGSSGSYVYDDVPPEIDAEFRAIEASGGSVGKYFQAEVRNKFRATKLTALPPAELCDVVTCTDCELDFNSTALSHDSGCPICGKKRVSQ